MFFHNLTYNSNSVIVPQYSFLLVVGELANLNKNFLFIERDKFDFSVWLQLISKLRDHLQQTFL